MRIQRTVALIGISAAMLGTAAAGETVIESVPAGQGGTVTFSRPVAAEQTTVALYTGKGAETRAETRRAPVVELRQISVGNAGLVTVFVPQ